MKDISMLPSNIHQMKVSSGTEANIGFGGALMPSYLRMHPPKASFFWLVAQLYRLVDLVV